MGLVVKALVLALLTLPVMAYVTGSMVGARSELPAQREPVVIGDRMDVAPQQTIRSEPPRPADQDDRDARDNGDDRPDGGPADSDDSDDTDVSVVRPQPREIDDDADDRDDGPDDDTGDSGDDSGGDED
jgi:hypothetical protein